MKVHIKKHIYIILCYLSSISIQPLIYSDITALYTRFLIISTCYSYFHFIKRFTNKTCFIVDDLISSNSFIQNFHSNERPAYSKGCLVKQSFTLVKFGQNKDKIVLNYSLIRPVLKFNLVCIWGNKESKMHCHVPGRCSMR